MRENNFVETYKTLVSNRERMAEEAEKRIQESVNAREKFIKDYHSILESREARARRHGQYLEACKNDALSTAIKAIYISALEANTLTDEGLVLAENMVDTWIQENGGATKILNSCKNNTYLLSRLSQIVEDAAEEAVKDAENVEDDKEEEKEEKEDTKDNEEEKKEEDKSDDSNGDEPTQKELKDAISIIKKNAGKDDEVKNALDIILKKAEVNDKGEDESSDSEGDSGEDPLNDTDFEDEDDGEDASETKDDKDEGDSKEEEKEESEDESSDSEGEGESEDSSDPLNDTDFENDDSDEEDDETDVADDIADGAEEEDINIDGDEDESSKGKVFDELEKEDDVKKAIKLIRQRVADAEQSFIKKNAEDKKQIDELIGRISDNVKTVEDLNDEDSKDSKVAEESARMNKRRINEITNNRPLTILEKMTRSLHAGIIKDEVVKEQYTTESGKLDTAMVVESAKVMYAFLETINTLQLQKVDSKYIENILSEM